MIVVDSSVWVAYLVGSLDETHTGVLESGDVTGPPHTDFEVGSALLRMERKGALGDVPASELIAEYVSIEFERNRDRRDLLEAVELLDNASYADAIFLAMARRLGGTIMSADRGMLDAARIADVATIDARMSPYGR